jgi:hypothetical protein
METLEITREMYEALKKALPEKAVTKHPTKTYLSSIKAIYVTERLNDVFGCGAWQIKAEKVSESETGFVVVKTTLTIPKYGVYYESFGGNDNGGGGNKNFDLGDAYKGATTDGITKIGSYLGIGISVFQGLGNTTPPNTAPIDKNKELEKLRTHKTVEALGTAYKALPLTTQNLIAKEVGEMKIELELLIKTNNNE